VTSESQSDCVCVRACACTSHNSCACRHKHTHYTHRGPVGRLVTVSHVAVVVAVASLSIDDVRLCDDDTPTHARTQSVFALRRRTHVRESNGESFVRALCLLRAHQQTNTHTRVHARTHTSSTHTHQEHTSRTNSYLRRCSALYSSMAASSKPSMLTASEVDVDVDDERDADDARGVVRSSLSAVNRLLASASSCVTHTQRRHANTRAQTPHAHLSGVRSLGHLLFAHVARRRQVLQQRAPRRHVGGCKLNLRRHIVTHTRAHVALQAVIAQAQATTPRRTATMALTRARAATRATAVHAVPRLPSRRHCSHVPTRSAPSTSCGVRAIPP
jgi:hypothetical protein